MKSVEPCTGTSKRLQGEASTTTPTFGAMPVADETSVDSTATVEPSGWC